MRPAFGLATTIYLAAQCFAQAPAANQCVADLEAIPGFLLKNDTGAKDQLAQWGQNHFDDAFATANASASQVADQQACLQVLTRYIKAWRKGHLSVSPNMSAEKSSEPSATKNPKIEIPIRFLSAKTALLVLKSFAPEYRDPLIAALKDNHDALAAHPNWIIDVRGNGGGSDSSYTPLMSWLLPDEVVSVGAAWRVTPANLEGHQKVCAIFAPGDKEYEKFQKDVAERTRNAKEGSYVPHDDSGGMSYERTKPLEPKRPDRVAILIDGQCGSSCEEFVLIARQSFQVKLIGRRTYGSLDYSNLRPFLLPSGQRMLWYATSRSMRIPDAPVDLAGIPPDIYLPLSQGAQAKEDEMRRVQNWLEGGTLAPSPK